MRKSGLLLLVVLFLVSCQTGPQLSPEELQAKWRAPLVTSAMNVGICTGVTETAQKIQAGELEGFAAFGELLAAGIMIQAVDEALATAEPAADQAQLLAQMQADVEALRNVVGPWVNKETTSVEVLAVIGDVCADMNATFEQVAEAAADDGLTAEAARQMMDDATRSMEAALEEAK